MYYEILKEILENCNKDRYIISYDLEKRIREEVKRIEDEKRINHSDSTDFM